jgi:hypothetical protein
MNSQAWQVDETEGSFRLDRKVALIYMVAHLAVLRQDRPSLKTVDFYCASAESRTGCYSDQPLSL